MGVSSQAASPFLDALPLHNLVISPQLPSSPMATLTLIEAHLVPSVEGIDALATWQVALQMYRVSSSASLDSLLR